MPTGLSWTESAKRDRWTLNEFWSVRKRGSYWFVWWQDNRIKRPCLTAEKAMERAEQMIAEEDRLP